LDIEAKVEKPLYYEFDWWESAMFREDEVRELMPGIG
jgi:hypothetical protein